MASNAHKKERPSTDTAPTDEEAALFLVAATAEQLLEEMREPQVPAQKHQQSQHQQAQDIWAEAGRRFAAVHRRFDRMEVQVADQLAEAKAVHAEAKAVHAEAKAQHAEAKAQRVRAEALNEGMAELIRQTRAATEELRQSNELSRIEHEARMKELAAYERERGIVWRDGAYYRKPCRVPAVRKHVSIPRYQYCHRSAMRRIRSKEKAAGMLTILLRLLRELVASIKARLAARKQKQQQQKQQPRTPGVEAAIAPQPRGLAA